MNNEKLDAYSYILTIYLQRLEEKDSGLIAELIAGVTADQEVSIDSIQNNEHVQAVFEETLILLHRANYKTRSIIQD